MRLLISSGILLTSILTTVVFVAAQNCSGNDWSITQNHNDSLDENLTGDHSSSHNNHRYKVANFDFEGVGTPFTIGICLLFASLAKIGEDGIIIFLREQGLQVYEYDEISHDSQ